MYTNKEKLKLKTDCENYIDRVFMQYITDNDLAQTVWEYVNADELGEDEDELFKKIYEGFFNEFLGWYEDSYEDGWYKEDTHMERIENEIDWDDPNNTINFYQEVSTSQIDEEEVECMLIAIQHFINAWAAYNPDVFDIPYDEDDDLPNEDSFDY